MKNSPWMVVVLLGVLVLSLSIAPFQESDSWSGDSEDGDSDYALVIY